MLTITPQQGRERYAVIPEELQNLIFAESTGELFEHIGEENHLDETKTYELGRVAGLVLLGFLHRDDTRKELQEAQGVNPMIANELQNELNRKLFAPITQVLDKIYSPFSKNTLSSTKNIDSVVSSKPVFLDNMPKPATLPSATPIPEIKNLGLTPKPPFAPATPPAALPPFGTAPISPNAPGESLIKKSPFSFAGSPIPSQTPASQPVPAPKPMPFATQTTAQSAPVGNVPKFKIENPGVLSGSAFGESSAPTFASAPRPAKIELGFTKDEKKPVFKPTITFETQKSSVRYGAPQAPSFAPSPSSPESNKPATQSSPLPPKFEPPKPL